MHIKSNKAHTYSAAACAAIPLSVACDDAAPSGSRRRRLKRKPAAHASNSPEPPASLHRQRHQAEVRVGVSAQEADDGATNEGNGCGAAASDDKASAVAALGIKLFPSLPPDEAAALWVGFVNDAMTCIKHYNNEHQANFVYRHALSTGFYRVEEQDDSCYYHLNFQAQDTDGHSQLFFGEIKECAVPQVEDVTCCCLVSPSDAGGKGIRTIEAVKHVFPDWDTAGYDLEHCYACTPRLKHPKGTCYVAGHFADTRQYYGFLD